MSRQPHIAACPACVALPDTAAIAAQDAGRDRAHGQGAGAGEAPLLLSLPGIHCAGCISGVEGALTRQPGVISARVNLTLKRVSVQAAEGVSALDLAAVLTAAGYEAWELDAASLSMTQTDARGRYLLIRLAVAFFAMMNVMLLSVAVWSGATDATRDMFHWISAAIALPAVAFCAQPFFISAWAALRGRRLNMDVPISLAILLAAGMSLYETSQGGEAAYFDAALSLTLFLLAGRYLDHRTRSVARSAAQHLAALEVPRALRADGESVALSDLKPGDLVRVLPGTRVPVDGVVTEGASEVDRSLLTGESLPVRVSVEAALSAGEVNLTGPLLVRVTAAGADSSLHRMADLVAMAESARNRYTSLADRAARIYAPAVHLLALLAFAGWLWLSGDIRLALNIAVAVLIITCPCALGLAVPAVSTAASGRLFKDGMLIKDATALERLAEVDVVVFDKTGTLTRGQPELVMPGGNATGGSGAGRVEGFGEAHRTELRTEYTEAQSEASGEVPGAVAHAAAGAVHVVRQGEAAGAGLAAGYAEGRGEGQGDGHSEGHAEALVEPWDHWGAWRRRDLEITLALAQGSAHPLSRALVEALGQAGVVAADLSALREVPGDGIEALWQDTRVRLGRAAWLGADVTEQTATWLQIGTCAPVMFPFRDHLREGAAEAVLALQGLGHEVLLLSGDVPAVVSDLAAQLGISRWQAGASPAEKAAQVTALKQAGHKVLMVGDGLNDTAALAAAHVSISPASALEATRVVSDIVLLGTSLAPLGAALRTARDATRRIRENFAIAAGYNAIAVPLALAGFATPLAAALAMSSSSVLVSLNALRLRGRGRARAVAGETAGRGNTVGSVSSGQSFGGQAPGRQSVGGETQ
jgi:cation transport ATPase